MEPIPVSWLERTKKIASDWRFWGIGLALVGIACLHYLSPQVRTFPFLPFPVERHTVERILFLLPIAGAVLTFGQTGGLITLALALVLMLPRVLWISPSPADAILETAAVVIVGYFVVWAVETRAREKRLRYELSQRLQRAYERLQTLYESAQAVNSTLELQQVLDRLVESTAKAMKVQGCSIWLLDEKRTRLTLEAVYGLSEMYMKKGDLVLERNPLAREVLAGKVVVVDNVATDARLQYRAEAVAEGICSMLSAPLIAKRGPLGLIRAYCVHCNRFTEEDAAFLSAIANQSSIAIENALAYQELSKLDQMKSRFVLMVTHELRSPVSVVRSLLRTLSAGYAGTLTDTQTDMVARALRRADFLQTLIDDLLDLASGKSEMTVAEERVPVRLDEVVKRVVERFAVPAQEKNIKLEWRCDCGDQPITIAATNEGMDRILNNLVSNAIKYTPSGGHVSVMLRRTEGGASLDVTDSGIGIPEDALAHLFEEFYRAPNAKAMEKEGTGLGLVITKDLVTRYGGRIAVQSQVGQGTTFTVTFPLA